MWLLFIFGFLYYFSSSTYNKFVYCLMFDPDWSLKQFEDKIFEYLGFPIATMIHFLFLVYAHTHL